MGGVPVFGCLDKQFSSSYLIFIDKSEDGWMDGWINGSMDQWINGSMDQWMDGWIDGSMDR